MATKAILKLRVVAPDAIQTALKMNPLSASTIRELEALARCVEKAPEVTQRHQRRTLENDFLELIVPILERTLTEHQNNPRGFMVNKIEGFSISDVSNSTLDELLHLHEHLTSQENSLKVRILLVRYQRGMIYQRAHRLITKFDDLCAWFSSNFNITYSTATSYMSIASLLSRHPILLKTGLSFEQLRRHNKRLIKYLSDKEAVDEQVDISDGTHTAAIEGDAMAYEVPDCGALDADFELVKSDERGEDDFPFFAGLTALEDDADGEWESCDEIQ